MPFSKVSPVRRHLRAKSGVLEENSDYGMAPAEHIRTPFSNSAAKHWLILATVTVTIGLTAGLGGMVRSLLLHFVRRVAYGHRLHSIASHESFLEGGLSACNGVLGWPREHSAFHEMGAPG